MAHDFTFKDVHCLSFHFKFHLIKSWIALEISLGTSVDAQFCSIVTLVIRWFSFMSNTTYWLNCNCGPFWSHLCLPLSLRHLWTNDWLLAPSIYLLSPFNEHWSLLFMLSGDPSEVVCHPFIILLNLSFSFFTRKRRAVFRFVWYFVTTVYTLVCFHHYTIVNKFMTTYYHPH